MNFFLTSVLIAIVSCTLADAYVLVGSWESMATHLQQKCNNNAHNNQTYWDLKDSYEHYLPTCFAKVMGSPAPTLFDDQDLFCRRIGNPSYYTCIENLTEKLSPCLDEDEAYLPNFMLTTYNVSMEDFCGANGLYRVTEILNDIRSSTCGINQETLQNIYVRCLNNLIITRNLENNVFTLKKDDLCSDIRTYKQCIIQSLTDLCHEDHTVTVNFLIDPFLFTC